MRTPVKEPDEAIERVMEALRSPQMPAGLERRTLAAVEERAAMRAEEPAGWLGWMRSARARRSPRFALAWAAGVVALAVTSASLLLLPRGGHTDGGQSPEAHGALPPLHASETASRQAGRDDRPITPQPNRRRSGRLRGDSREKIAEATESVSGYATFAPSFPAPPMPLTDQERLMLRLVHRRDPVEMAELNPVARAEQNAEERAEFQKFFTPPTTGDHE